MVSHTVDLEFPGLLAINFLLKSNSPAGSLITPGSITQHGIQLYQPWQLKSFKREAEG